MLAGFMMAYNTTRAGPQHAVMTGEVARNPTNRCTLQATGRVCPRRHEARRQHQNQTCGQQISFHRVYLVAGVNALWLKQTEQENIP